MTTLQTFFRAVVMFATLGIVAKAWHLYGPSVEEMQTIGQRVAEVTDELINEYRQGGAAAPGTAEDPRIQVAPPIVATAPQAPINRPQPVLLATAESSQQEYAQPAVAALPVVETPPAPPTRLIPVAPEQTPTEAQTGVDARLEAAGARLAQLGVSDQTVEPWGGDGRWYRCSCNAPWVDAPHYSRHFEAVAADPASAVEQVAAEIDAWQKSHSSTLLTR